MFDEKLPGPPTADDLPWILGTRVTDNFLNTRTYSRSRLSFVSCINSETTSFSFWHCCINSSASPYSSLKALLLQFNSFFFLVPQALLFQSKQLQR